MAAASDEADLVRFGDFEFGKARHQTILTGRLASGDDGNCSKRMRACTIEEMWILDVRPGIHAALLLVLAKFQLIRYDNPKDIASEPLWTLIDTNSDCCGA